MLQLTAKLWYGTDEGVDMLCRYDVQIQTNHLSHFLLTAELMPLLEKAAARNGDARVVSHSSIARKTPSAEFLPAYFDKTG